MNTDLLDAQELLAVARLDFEKERYDQALVRLKQASASNEGQIPEVWALLGAVYGRLRLWAKAQQFLIKFLEARPQSLNERFQLGMTYFDAGDPGKALEVWQQILQAEKLHPPALYYSGLASARLGRLAQALQYCDTVLAQVAQDNLFHGRAKELFEQLRADPRLRPAETGDSTPRKSH